MRQKLNKWAMVEKSVPLHHPVLLVGVVVSLIVVEVMVALKEGVAIFAELGMLLAEMLLEDVSVVMPEVPQAQREQVVDVVLLPLVVGMVLRNLVLPLG